MLNFKMFVCEKAAELVIFFFPPTVLEYTLTNRHVVHELVCACIFTTFT